MSRSFIPGLGMALILSCPLVLDAQPLFPDPYGEPISRTISFWRNDGQVVDSDNNIRPDVHFVSEGTQPKMFLREKSKVSLAYLLRDSLGIDPDGAVRIDISPTGQGAQGVEPTGHQLRQYTKHFWLEHTTPNPVLDVPGYGWVVYEDIYPGIDWHWYGGSSGTKMAFVCQPGSDPNAIMLHFEGQDSLRLDWQGALKAYLNGRWLRFEEAMAFQYDTQQNIQTLGWNANYQIVGDSTLVRLQFSTYDPSRPLVFWVGYPPMMAASNDQIPYSTYLGTAMEDVVNDLAIAENGDFYIVGDNKDMQLPADVGFAPSWIPNQTGILAKFNVDYEKIWVGHYGQHLRSIALDEPNQRIIVGGATAWSLYTQQFQGGYILNSPGNAGSIAMFTMTELGVTPDLLWSTHWKSTYLNRVAVDAAGRIYVAGTVHQSTPYLVMSPGGIPGVFYQPDHHGNLDGYLACFDENTNLLWSTLYGGEGNDHIMDLVVDSDLERILIAGRTTSTGNLGGFCQVIQGQFPQCAQGTAFSQVYCNGNNQGCTTFGSADGFIALFSLDMQWIWSTRFGGPSSDWITAARLTPGGEILIAGVSGWGTQQYCATTCAPPTPVNQGFPHCVWPGAHNSSNYQGNGDHFIARFDQERQLVWSTYVGGPGYEIFDNGVDGANSVYPMHGPRLTVDEVGDIYMAGSTTSGGSSYPGSAPFPTPQHGQYYHNGNHNGLAEPPPTDRSDAYVAKIDGSTGAVVMGTFYGGRGGVPVNWPYFSLNGDMVTSLRTRHSRLFLTGATTSYWWFPVNALDGVSTSFLQYTPPANQIAGATDITHGFIAQLSWLNAPVGIQEVRPTEVSLIHAWFLADGSLVLDLPAGGVATSTLVEVFDAQGKLVFSDRALPGMTRVQLATGGLASGLYLGRLQGTPYRFKAMRH